MTKHQLNYRKRPVSAMTTTLSNTTKIADSSPSDADRTMMQERLTFLRKHIAQPIPRHDVRDGASVPWSDPTPGYAGGNLFIGNKCHASNVPLLQELGITAVLNCASGGISRLPVDELKEAGIRYAFTNVRRDDYEYPILHTPKKKEDATAAAVAATAAAADESGSASSVWNWSQHLQVAKALYNDTLFPTTTITNTQKQPNVMFFCVAGQNRSAALAIAVLMLHGHSLDEAMHQCSATRPFVLENEGFQQQLIELELLLATMTPLYSLPINYSKEDGDDTAAYSFYAWGDEQPELPPTATSTTITTPSNTTTDHMMPSQDGDINRDDQALLIRTRSSSSGGTDISLESTSFPPVKQDGSNEENAKMVEIELLIPGLCTLECLIPQQSTIADVKTILVTAANEHVLLSSSSSDQQQQSSTRIAKSWLVLAMFGFDSMYDLPLEESAMESQVQLELMESMFGLHCCHETAKVHWNERCRFALVIFSVFLPRNQVMLNNNKDSQRQQRHPIERLTKSDSEEGVEQYQAQVPWTFRHEERPGAPATLLENTLMSTHLRGWDFCTGQAYASKQPIVFSFADPPTDRRSFMKISTSANEAQQFHAPGEGGILGMGSNAIVHRVLLLPTSANGPSSKSPSNSSYSSTAGEKKASTVSSSTTVTAAPWDAAVKRPFGLDKMLAFLENSSEAGLAKRLRLANSLNPDGRVLFFYGLGVGLSANADDQNEYKFEASLLARYEEEFASYTLRRFMEDYIAIPEREADVSRRDEVARLQAEFSLISVKILLVSLLNAFRDLTLMGVQAFDFNHLNNVLVSRDHRTVKLLDIDGNSKGSIQFPSEYIEGRTLSPRHPSTNSPTKKQASVHKPSLDVDLNTVLPTVVQQLILGKGQGNAFVVDTKSKIWKADPEEAKEMIRAVIRANFFKTKGATTVDIKTEKHIAKVAEWFHAMLRRESPWNNWTNDIYDAMRCIDHLPIT